MWGAVSCRMESGSSRKDRGLLSSPLKAALSSLSSVLFWCLLQEGHLLLGFLQDSDNVSSVRAGVCVWGDGTKYGCTFSVFEASLCSKKVH